MENQNKHTRQHRKQHPEFPRSAMSHFTSPSNKGEEHLVRDNVNHLQQFLKEHGGHF